MADKAVAGQAAFPLTATPKDSLEALMTTLADREHAIEAHHALLELAAFKERLHRYKELGLRVAVRLGLQGNSAEQFAVGLAERFCSEPTYERLCSRLAAELSSQGAAISPAEIRHMALDDDETAQLVLKPSPPQENWIEFVIIQLLSLFGARTDPTDDRPSATQPTRSKPGPLATIQARWRH